MHDTARQGLRVQIIPTYSGFASSGVSIRLGIYPSQTPVILTLGYCLVGTVRALGDNCTSFKSGDTVAVLTKYDTQAKLANQIEKYCIKVVQEIGICS
jgi:NADPH:quinone reductase-like Zn-dependent oxidoreductase